MTIGETVRRLLAAGEKVILPGFGNLVIVDKVAGIPDSGKHLDPPGRRVRFNSSSSKDDGKLAGAFAGDASLNEEEAGQQVLELVDAIRFALDKGETYILEGAGKFSRDDDGKVRFDADKDWLIEPDQYGLESMELLELEDEPALQEEVKAEPATAADRSPEPVTRPAPPPSRKREEQTKAHEPWKDDKSHRKSRLWKIIWGVAGALILILLTLILVPAEKLPFLGGKNRPDTNETVSGSPSGETEAGQAAGSGTDITPSGPANAVPDAAETAPVTEPAVTEPALPPANKYFLVAGSFRNLANASELQDKLKEKGYKAEVMMTENRMYRVTAASYATRGEAERALARIKSVPGLESCWLLSN